MSELTIIICLVLAILLAALAFSVTFYIWIYKDACAHGQKGALWVVIAVLTSPVIGWLIYFIAIRRQEFVKCHSCGHLILKSAQYCENCGSINSKDNLPAKADSPSFWKYFIAGLVSFLVLAGCTAALVIYVFMGDGAAFDHGPLASLNTGYVMGNMETKWNGVWSVKSKKASDGYHHDTTFRLEDPAHESLNAEISCEKGTLTLELIQDEQKVSMDVSDLSEPLNYPLSQFQEGKIRVRLIRHGAENIQVRIQIKEETDG